MYVGYWVKCAAPFQLHYDAQKLVYYHGNFQNAHPFFSYLDNFGTETVKTLGQSVPLHMALQGDGSVDNRHLGSGFPFVGSGSLLASVTNVFIIGQWNRVESFMRESSTLTSRDGVCRVWVNGTQIMNYTNINTEQNGGFTGIIINPVYGGGTATSKAQEDYIYFGHARITMGSGGVINPPVQSGLLQGSRSTPPATLNLSSEGVTDWVHVGRGTSASARNEKAAATTIGAVQAINGTAGAYGDNHVSYNWSNGTPISTESGTTTGLYVNGTGGFRLTLPADTTQRTLKIYSGCYNTTMTMQASLSDGSANAYSDGTFSAGAVAGGAAAVWTFLYRAGAANQSLTVNMTANSTAGNVTFQAATLVVSGDVLQTPTITSFTPSSGLVGSSVTITGTNFDPLAANNTVKFNGTTASVSTASTTSLSVTVPSGASTGTITVTTAGGTATSGSSFTVDTTPEPETPPEAGIGGAAMLILFMP
jgi:hypothetical protein